MDTHGAATVAQADHEYAVPESGERFEKAELKTFVADDQFAGQVIGKLLAAVFLISFVLMISVCTWMVRNMPTDIHDPQAGIGVEADEAHH